MSDLTTNDVLTRAGRAIERVETLGKRGLSMVTENEIEALIMLAVAQGVPPVARDEQVADSVQSPVKSTLKGDLT